jgi:ferritin-like metal-binding protein YciE
MQKAGDCDFFELADKEIFAYEKRLTEHLQQMKERRLADNDRVKELIERKCKEHYDQIRRELGLG